MDKVTTHQESGVCWIVSIKVLFDSGSNNLYASVKTASIVHHVVVLCVWMFTLHPRLRLSPHKAAVSYVVQSRQLLQMRANVKRTESRTAFYYYGTMVSLCRDSWEPFFQSNDLTRLTTQYLWLPAVPAFMSNVQVITLGQSPIPPTISLAYPCLSEDAETIQPLRGLFSPS